MKRNPLPIIPALILSLLSCAFAQAPAPSTVTYPQGFAVSPPLSAIRSAPSGPAELKVRRRRPIPHHFAKTVNSSDGAAQTVSGKPARVRENPNFPGMSENGYIPSDANIAVGPNHIVQVVNSDIAIFDKNGNVFSGYPKTLGSLWAAMGGPCATNNAGDPVVQYDRLADRFIVTELGSQNSPYSECIAVSVSGDPTGSYYLYSYSFGSNLNDYPKFGVWPATTNPAYLATYNLFANGASFVGADLCAYDRTAMLSGAPSAASICFQISGGGYLPVDLDGSTPPPGGAPGYFMGFDSTSSLRIYQLTPDFANPASSTLSGGSEIAVASFNEACGGGTCIPQPGTSQQLSSLGDRLMYRLAYRRFADHEAMVAAHSVTAGSSVGMRWYELRKTTGSFVLYQQGTFAPDSTYRWMGSIAMDQVGDIALGYSASSAALFPSINYTGRTPADPLNTMEAEKVLVAGAGSQTGFDRWGDYTALRIDPSDDCTFWYTNEYYHVTSSYVWNTAIGSWKFANCTASADFTVSASAAPLTLSAGQPGSSTGSVSVTSLNGFSSTVALSGSAACGTNGITCTVTPSSETPPAGGSAASNLSIATTSATPAGSYTITIVGSSGSLVHSSSLTLTVQPAAADFTISASPTSLIVKRGQRGKVAVSVGTVGGSSSVNLSASGLPKKTSASFSPNPVTTPGSSTLTLAVNKSAPTGTYSLTVTGANGNFSHSTALTLTIQ